MIDLAGLGHLMIAVFAAPLAAPRAFDRREISALAFQLTAISYLPDADVIAFVFGIPYEHAFGHRGATHSLAFAILIAAIAAAIGPRLAKLSRARAAFLFGAVTLTHPLLDMLTDGGLGCALFFPLSDARLFFGWRPIPVSPIGPGVFSDYGFRVLATELAYFSPLLIGAGALLFRRTRST